MTVALAVVGGGHCRRLGAGSGDGSRALEAIRRKEATVELNVFRE